MDQSVNATHAGWDRDCANVRLTARRAHFGREIRLCASRGARECAPQMWRAASNLIA